MSYLYRIYLINLFLKLLIILRPGSIKKIHIIIIGNLLEGKLPVGLKLHLVR